MSRLAKIFEVKREGLNVPRALMTIGLFLIVLLVVVLVGEEKYWENVTFGALFVALSDPGGPYGARLRAMTWVALGGAFVTGLGYAIGGGSWGIVVIASFLITFLSALTIKFGVRAFTAALLVNSWFLVAIAVPEGHHLHASNSGWWQQALAWLVGAALFIALTFVSWLLKGRKEQATHFPEISGDTPTALTRPVVLFFVIRALAIAIAVAIAFGFGIPNADWMPIATLVAMQSTLGQAALASEQRFVGALCGALLAALFLATVDNHRALEIVIVILAAIAGTFRGANYAIYCICMAAVVLIVDDISNPANHSAEGRRILFTFIGLGIGLVVLLLAGLLKRHTAKAAPAAAAT
jgi:fusaric acid resistance family protein